MLSLQVVGVKELLLKRYELDMHEMSILAQLFGILRVREFQPSKKFDSSFLS